MSNIAIDIRPFTIFEGNNEMLYADIFDIFSKANDKEKENGVRIDKTQTLYERLLSDSRYIAINEKFSNISSNITDFLKSHAITDITQIQKVFIGKIISKFFIMNQATDDSLISFLNREMQKDILDFQYS